VESIQDASDLRVVDEPSRRPGPPGSPGTGEHMVRMHESKVNNLLFYSVLAGFSP